MASGQGRCGVIQYTCLKREWTVTRKLLVVVRNSVNLRLGNPILAHIWGTLTLVSLGSFGALVSR